MEKIIQEIYKSIDRLLVEPGIKIVAVDGNSAGGKSHLASLIEKNYSCNVFHMDDFFLPEKKKTPTRLNEIGGNVDRERFKSEIIEGILKGDKIKYQKFDCKSQSLGETVEAPPMKLNIVEGVYSMHPDLSSHYDFKIFISISKEEQSHRILLRDGPTMHKRFVEEWIPLENRYFSCLGIQEKCDITLELKNF